ncbi:MAG: exo-beta-N-acetylmuramidase NamZ family protein [bacterium]
MVVADNFSEFQGKRVGIITNHTGIDSERRHIADLFHGADGVKLVALFGPEHGIRGDAPAGAKIATHTDPKTGVPAYSLYGEIRKPTPEMLKDIDVLIYDIQDVGARFYTYTSTMALCMEAAAEAKIPFYVLDRPNPIGGLVEGPMLDPANRSFVGLYPIALRHGMTVGELAQMFNGEGWLKTGPKESPQAIKADLHVVPMQGWRHDMLFDETGLSWLSPSPNITALTTAQVYPGTCLLEATNLSEGRGTNLPFEKIGAPWIDSKKLIDKLQDRVPGIYLRPIDFIPMDIAGKAKNPKFKGTGCRGLQLDVTAPRTLRAVTFGVHLLCALHELHPKLLVINEGRMARLSGQSWIREMVLAGEKPEAILQRMEKGLGAFRELRQKYLLYE